MKKKKLILNKLKIQSFVTDIKQESVETVKGGGFTDNPGCGPYGPTIFRCTRDTAFIVVCGTFTKQGFPGCGGIPEDSFDLPNPY